jgi:hypothetical protein
MAKDISKRVSSTIFLKRAPDISSIQVSFGSLVLPAELKRGWSYDVSNNAIVLGDEVDLSGQPQGTRLKIFYNPAKFEEEK